MIEIWRDCGRGGFEINLILFRRVARQYFISQKTILGKVLYEIYLNNFFYRFFK